jgi:hypothetical protein
MQGRYVEIGGRRTYFPPFANEVFGNSPYWACTFTSLLNGANVAWLGQWPNTPSEIRALAKASGDVDTRGGSRSSHMIAAMRVRYNRKMAIEALPPEWVKKRLATGWAMVGAVTYGALPAVHRKPSPHFKGGHRVVLIGWQNGATRLLDPMERQGADFTGRFIQWSDFEPAWWSAEQLWFQEGMFLRPPDLTPIARFHPARTWSMAAGRLVVGRSPDDARKIVLQVRPKKDSDATFDQYLVATPHSAGAEPLGRFIHVTSGPLKGLLVDPRTPGLTADLTPGPTPAKPAASAAAAAKVGPGATPEDALELARREAAQVEYQRVKTAFEASGTLPDPPA